MSPPCLSLTGTSQPTGISGVAACHLDHCTGYADMYRGDVAFIGRIPLLPIVAKAFRVLADDHEGIKRLQNMVHRLQEDWSTVCHDHEYVSPAWSGILTVAGHTVPAIVTVYHPNGNILEYLGHHPRVDLLNLVRQTASALAHIHSKGVVHGNICPENICITDDSTVHMTDIGVNTLIRQTSERYRWSIPSNWMYKAGEELQHGTCNTQTDVYSFAATIYAMYTLKAPFQHKTCSYGRGLMQIVEQGHDDIFGGFKPVEMTEELWDIIRMCWTMDPIHRPSMLEVSGRLKRIHGTG